MTMQRLPVLIFLFLLNLTLVLLSLTPVILSLAPGNAHAQPNCSSLSRITHDFNNGASWDMCWESRIRENLVLSDVHYTPPGQDAIKVLGSARLSQLHVAYDDSDVTYNDVTQYGLGGSYLLTLTQADCPNGELLDIQTRPALCLWQTQADNGYRTPSRAAAAESINLFSVSQVGAYAYIVSWTFYDDGSFEPGVGATGALQRSSNDTDLPFGRVLQGDPDTLWLSHTHNYYWRLDFDLGSSASDDVVSELRYALDAQGRRIQESEVFTTEQARRIDPAAQQVWRILENAETNAAGYQIEPVRNGHRFERKTVEPYTEFDFFVTVGNDCERFASQNARFNPDCLNHVLQFVDDQSLVDQDIVLWNRVSFHHTPRSEDQRHMHTHWDDFLIKPVNLLNGTGTLSDLPNAAPEIVAIADRRTQPDELVHSDVASAIDPDGDLLSFSAAGLPPGLEMRLDGHVHGHPTTTGIYSVEVTARDDQSAAQTTFQWTIGEVAANDGAVAMSDKTASGSSSWYLLLVLLLTGFRRKGPPVHHSSVAEKT